MQSFSEKKVLVTGGAGFIGSHIVDHLVGLGAEVLVYDNLSTGRKAYLDNSIGKIELAQADILDASSLEAAMEAQDFVFHLAANADVRGGIKNTRVDLDQNIIGTHNVLEAMRKKSVSGIAFSSSATVYGEPKNFPTPETEPLIQTSIYGASKLSAEALIQAYTEYFNWKSYSFRFVSWIGERYSHGVIFDFMKKLKQDPTRLEILGNGEQRKSYLYIEDGVRGIFHAIQSFEENKNVFNLGHRDFMNVKDLAQIVIEELDLKDVKFEFTGGERGWLGDSPFVHLDTSKLCNKGWEAETSIEDGIRRTVRYLKDHPEILDERN